MFISKKMQDAINKQIQAEFYSAYLYLSMSAHFQKINLPGVSSWLRTQYEEERAHALKLYDYVLERGGEVELMAIDKPEMAWESPLAAFKEVFQHEQHVTSLITELYETAVAEKDYATQVLLQWFITEQVEEEDNAAQVVANLEMVETRQTAVLMLDHRMGKRGED
jgi:ferritin